MPTVLFIIGVVVVACLFLWATNELPNIDGTLRSVLRVAIIIVAAVFIGQRLGFW